MFNYLSRWSDKEAALELWTIAQKYDCSPESYGCDETLIRLGLAQMGYDPDSDDPDEVILYWNIEEQNFKP